MKHIKDLIYNINDIVLAILIVAVAAGIIYWRMNIILDYPEKVAHQNAIEQRANE